MAVAELIKSRRVVHTRFGVTVLRFYKALSGDLTAGASGWTASGLPLLGDDLSWTDTTWLLYTHTPECVGVDIDPRSTKTKGIFKVTYSADLKWA